MSEALPFTIMGDFIKTLIETIFNKTRNNAQKVFYFFFIVTAAIMINDYYGITKNLLLNRRLNQLEKLKAISPAEFENDTIIVREIADIKQSMFDKSGISAKARIWISEQAKSVTTPRGISATFILLLAMAIAPFTLYRQSKNDIIEYIAIFVLTEILLAGVAIVLYKIQSLIPTLRPIFFNHIINVVLQFYALFLFSKLSPPKKKEKVTVKDALLEEYLKRMILEKSMQSQSPGNTGSEESAKDK